MDETCLANRHQSGQGVADDRHPRPTIKSVRHTGQLEGQRSDLGPVDQPRQSAVGQNRHGKRLVLAVSPPQPIQFSMRNQVISTSFQNRSPFRCTSRQVNRRCDEHGCGDV